MNKTVEIEASGELMAMYEEDIVTYRFEQIDTPISPLVMVMHMKASPSVFDMRMYEGAKVKVTIEYPETEPDIPFDPPDNFYQ